MTIPIKPNNSAIGNLKGVRLQIFCYILRIQEEVGISQIQRALGLKTPSHGAYHLQKLSEQEFLIKTQRNTYTLNEEFNVKSLRLNTLVDYYLIRGRFWPKSAFLASFIMFSMLTSLILILLDLIVVLFVFVLLSFTLTLFSLVKDVILQYRSMREEDNDI